MPTCSKRRLLGDALDGTAFPLPGKTAVPKQDKTKADPLRGKMRPLGTRGVLTSAPSYFLLSDLVVLTSVKHLQRQK